jgi:DNA-binding SARP family transcriptional activator/DNA-binding transcriptional ArsR family regulator
MERLAPLLRCEVIGQTTVSIGDDRLAGEGELVFALALFLGLNPGEELPRDFVAHMLWPSYDEEAARHSLRQLIYRVRTLGLAVTTRADVLQMAPECVAVDFATLLTAEPSRETYLGFSRFDVLAGYSPTFSSIFSQWVEEFRERLGIKLRNGLVACIADARARGRYRDVSQLAKHCLSLDPLNEEATLALAEATALAGNKVAALRMLEAYQSDLGVASGLRLQTDLLRRRIAERLNVYSAQPHDVEMLGREDAMEYLLRGVHALSSGAARSLLMTGEAGVGKTRLLTEFAKVTALHNVRTVVLRCHPGWREQPLTAITDLVTTLLQLPGALGASPDAMSALQALTSTLPRRSDVGMYAGEADAMLANLRWSVLDLFEAVMQEKRLVLLVDNVQWLDELSEHFLDYVLGRCAKRPLYLVMTSREGADALEEEGKRPLLATEHRLVLRPLDDATARALVRQVVELTDRLLSEASVDSCVRRCGGNPYFLSELARFYLVSGPDAVPPVTLRTFIEYRLGKVSQSARRALEVVAILGSFATLRRIQRVLELRGSQVLSALEALQRAGLVDLVGDLCEPRHDVVREVVESMISTIARRVLHLRAARLLRQEFRLAEDPALLSECGQHLLKSGDRRNAPRGALLLARRLLQLGAAERAAELAALAAERTEDATVISCQLIRARALRALGKWAAVREVAAQSGSLPLGMSGRRAQLDLSILEAEADLAEGVKRREAIERLVTVVTSEDSPWPQRLRAARVVIVAADHWWDLQLAERVATTLAKAPLMDGELGTLLITSRMILSTVRQDWTESTKHATSLVEHSSRLRSRQLRSQSIRFAANGMLRSGDLDGARRLLQESHTLSESLDHWWHLLSHYFLSFTVELQDGQLSVAGECLRAARSIAGKLPRSSRLQLELDIMHSELAIESGGTASVPWTDYRRLRDQIRPVDPRLWQTTLAVLLLHPRARSRRAHYSALQAELELTLHSLVNSGWQDLAVYALAASYLESGGRDKALSEIKRYLDKNRGVRAKLRPRLAHLAVELGIPAHELQRRSGTEPVDPEGQSIP